MATLIFTAGPRAGERIDVTTEIIIGRENCDLTILDAEMSRRHARVRPTGDTLEIEDLASTNGTWVDGSRIDGTAALADGAQVKVGETTLSVEVPQPAVDAGATRLQQAPVDPGATALRPTPPPPDATTIGTRPQPPVERAPEPPTAPQPVERAPEPPAAPPVERAPEPPAAPPPIERAPEPVREPPPVAREPEPVAREPEPVREPPPAAREPEPRRPLPVATGAPDQPFGALAPAASQRQRGRVATRLWGPAAVVMGTIGATAIALIVYFAGR
jgi:predicted component of type VI protein secretion system